MSIKSELFHLAKLQRHTLRRLEKRVLQGVRLDASPILFANSFPKSGTHLLTQIMAGFQNVGAAVDSGLPAVVMYEGASGRERSNQEILTDLFRFKPGDIGYGHLHACPEIKNLFTDPKWCGFFILRDPRDVVVSHVHYVTDMEPNHVHHEYYINTLKTFDERLKTSILGRPDIATPFPNIAERFAPFLGWLKTPEVLVLKYEDLMTNPAASINSILDHAISKGFTLKYTNEDAVKILTGMINPQRSPTFRQGKTGGWKKHFSPEITQLFKAASGDLLQILNYEKNNDWAA